MDELVLWSDETVFLRRIGDGGGLLALSTCPQEQAVARYICDRGFAVQRGKAVRLSERGRFAAKLATEASGPLVRVPVEDLADG